MSRRGRGKEVLVGESVTFPGNGRTVGGYLAVPDKDGGPAVVVIQEWWGLVDHIKDVADRLAATGFVALAPDLYDGRIVGLHEPDEAGKAMMELDMGRATQEMAAAFDHLLNDARVEPKRIGAIGFCMGGTLAMTLATVRPVAAVVDYYGGPLKGQLQVEKIRGPVLGHFAADDDWANPLRARELLDRLHRLGLEAEFYTYPGTGHAFFNNDRPEVHNPKAAALSWDRTIEFLHRHLD
jgi:carboxymethylenebutenolidase